MSRRGRHPAIASHVPIDSELEHQWQKALLSRPDNNDAAALEVWNRTYGDLLTKYQRAVASAQEGQAREVAQAKVRAKARRQFRLLMGAVAASIAVAVGLVVHLANRPSEDEVRQREIIAQEAACTAHYQQAHRVKLVTKQIDLLKEGEGGWVELYTLQGASPVIGSLDLSPAELQAGKSGKATVNREAYIYENTLGVGSWALLERRDGHLVLTLFFISSGFGELPHAPLHVTTTTTVVARGEALSPVC